MTFKRAIGVDPLASYFTVYTSGQGIAAVIYGGRNGARVHRFDLNQGGVLRLQRLLRHTQLRDAAIRNPGLYTYWVITNTASHRLQQGRVPRSAQPLLRALTAIADANHLD